MKYLIITIALIYYFGLLYLYFRSTSKLLKFILIIAIAIPYVINAAIHHSYTGLILGIAGAGLIILGDSIIDSDKDIG